MLIRTSFQPVKSKVARLSIHTLRIGADALSASKLEITIVSLDCITGRSKAARAERWEVSFLAARCFFLLK